VNAIPGFTGHLMRCAFDFAFADPEVRRLGMDLGPVVELSAKPVQLPLPQTRAVRRGAVAPLRFAPGSSDSSFANHACAYGLSL
jgi:hypothetical protein